MTTEVDVGVVVPAFQAERYLAATLESVRGQSLASWRCLVIDDGSTDGTRRVAQTFVDADARFSVINQRNLGLAAVRNVGLSRFVGECHAVMFLDSDDLLAEDALEHLFGALADRPDAVAASGWAEYIDGSGTPIHTGEHRDIQRHRLEPNRRGTRLLDAGEDTTFLSLTVEGRIWPPATALVRPRTAVAAGCFDEEMVPQEDWEFYLRLSRFGPVVFVDRQVAWYRRHADNATNNAATRAIRAQAQLRAKTWRSRQTTPEQRSALERAVRAKAKWESIRHLRQGREALRSFRPAVALAALWCVLLAQMELAWSRPIVLPTWLIESGVDARRYVRDSGVGTDGGRHRLIQ